MTAESDRTGEFSAAFTTTQWSEVLDARQTDPQRARAALENLCGRYWYPLYAFIRRRGHVPQDAEDLTQSFFEHILEQGEGQGEEANFSLSPAGSSEVPTLYKRTLRT